MEMGIVRTASSFLFALNVGAALAESRVWPLVTMRQMDSTSFAPDDMKAMIAINARHPGSCDEYWLAEGYPHAQTGAVERAKRLGEFAEPLRRAGIVPGFQQGVTLGHDFSRVPDGGIAFSDAAYQVDVDGKRTAFLCPTSPEVLAHEERYAETYVRLGRLESFWLDDDLRLGICKGRAAGCWCPRCLKLLNAKAGTDYTREEFVKRLDSSATNDQIRAVWGAFKAESLAGFAAAARRGAKRVNPNVRLGYQAISSASIACGADYRPILEALSDGFRDAVGIRPGHGFYDDRDSAWQLPCKLLNVVREAERCRTYPGWHGSVVYEQENYPHFAMQKSAEAIVKEGAVALAAGCDALSQYWYSSAHPEPFEHYEDVARLTAAWRPYMKRLADLAPQTHLGGVARRIAPDLMASRANTVSAQLENTLPRWNDADARLALMGVPVTVAEADATGFYDPASVPERHYSTAERAALLDALDALSGGPVCVRVEKVHPRLVYPRGDARGRTVAVTFLNVSVGLATRVPVRLRRPAGDDLAWARPCADDVGLEVERMGSDELRFVLPDLSAWSVATVFCGEANKEVR